MTEITTLSELNDLSEQIIDQARDLAVLTGFDFEKFVHEDDDWDPAIWFYRRQNESENTLFVDSLLFSIWLSYEEHDDTFAKNTDSDRVRQFFCKYEDSYVEILLN